MSIIVSWWSVTIWTSKGCVWGGLHDCCFIENEVRGVAEQLQCVDFLLIPIQVHCGGPWMPMGKWYLEQNLPGFLMGLL